MTTLVIGASAFVGRHLVHRLLTDQRDVRGAVHHNTTGVPASIDMIRGSLEPDFD